MLLKVGWFNNNNTAYWNTFVADMDTQSNNTVLVQNAKDFEAASTSRGFTKYCRNLNKTRFYTSTSKLTDFFLPEKNSVYFMLYTHTHSGHSHLLSSHEQACIACVQEAVSAALRAALHGHP